MPSKAPSTPRPSTCEDDLARLGFHALVELHDLAADHLADGLVDGHLRAWVGGDPGAVAHDRDAVGLLEDLFESVRDEEDGHALRAEPVDDGEELRHLMGGERGRGLVHDEHARVEREGLGDLDGLLLGQGQRRGRCHDVEVDVEARQHLLCLGSHPAPVDDPAAVAMTDEDVLGHGQVREDHGLLVDGRHRVGLGVEGTADVDLLTVDEDVADVGLDDTGHDLDER